MTTFILPTTASEFYDWFYNLTQDWASSKRSQRVERYGKVYCVRLGFSEYKRVKNDSEDSFELSCYYTLPKDSNPVKDFGADTVLRITTLPLSYNRVQITVEGMYHSRSLYNELIGKIDVKYPNANVIPRLETNVDWITNDVVDGSITEEPKTDSDQSKLAVHKRDKPRNMNTDNSRNSVRKTAIFCIIKKHFPEKSKGWILKKVRFITQQGFSPSTCDEYKNDYKKYVDDKVAWIEQEKDEDGREIMEKIGELTH